jgi:chromosome segregation ATPase
MRRDILFFTVLGSYIIAFAVTVLGITGGLDLDPQAKTPLITALIVEVAASVLALFKGLNISQADDDARKRKGEREVAALQEQIQSKDAELVEQKSELHRLNEARGKEILQLRHEFREMRDLKNEAVETLAKYKDACHKDVSRLESEIQELKSKIRDA